jgi:hypothetical protein
MASYDGPHTGTFLDTKIRYQKGLFPDNQSPVSSVQCPVSSVQCPVSSVHSSPTMPRGGTRNCIRSCASASPSPRAVHVHYQTYKDFSLLVLCQGRPAAYLADIGCGALLIMMDESLSPLLEE